MLISPSLKQIFIVYMSLQISYLINKITRGLILQQKHHHLNKQICHQSESNINTLYVSWISPGSPDVYKKLRDHNLIQSNVDINFIETISIFHTDYVKKYNLIHKNNIQC